MIYQTGPRRFFYVLIQHLDTSTLQCNAGKERFAAKLGRGSTEAIKRGLRELIKAGEVRRRLTKRSPLYTFPNLKGDFCSPIHNQGGTLLPSSETRGTLLPRPQGTLLFPELVNLLNLEKGIQKRERDRCLD